VVEGTPLLREHTGQNLYPGFESLRLRQPPVLPRPTPPQSFLLVARLRSQPAAITGATVNALFSALGKLGLTPAGRVQLGAKTEEPDAEDLWQRGEFARALAVNEFTEFAHPERRVTADEREEAARLREQWAAQRKGRR
jgi:hypothetical protein